MALPVFLFSRSYDTMPMNSWIYQSLSVLQTAGFFRDFDQGAKPYTRMQIAIHLKHLLQTSSPDSLANQNIEFRRIFHEFRHEIESQSDSTGDVSAFRGAFTFRDYYSTENNNNLFFRLNGFLAMNNRFSLKYSGYVDQSLADDPLYTGYEWRGFTGRQEQMYLAVSGDSWTLQTGRDYCQWGYGHSGNLFISANSGSFDMIMFHLKSRILTFQTFTAQLDPMYNANRYLTATRFEVNFKNRWYLGLGQSALYGGENRPLDLVISNPLAFYSFTQDNDHKAMNIMLYADFAWYFRNKYKFYGEFLIDDFQIDKEVKSDLEPDELGILCGLEWVNLLADINGYFELVQIRNRTYNVPEARPYEKFLQKNLPIGYTLGTDLQYAVIHLNRWLANCLRLDFTGSLYRQGEGTIHGKFTEPWMNNDVTMETSYSEKIPYGIVESVAGCEWIMHYEYTSRIQAEIGFQYLKWQNYEHIRDKSHSDIIFTCCLQIEYDRIWKFR